MKVSIITLVRIHNYGSVLQAYATGELVRQAGHDPEFVDLVAINGSRAGTLEDNVKAKVGGNSIKHALYSFFWNANWMLQERVFGGFVNRHLNFSRRYESVGELHANPPMADCYVSGSDMLWSSKLNKGHRETQFYLTWAPEDKPHIAYAASIGETELPPEERSFMLPLLKSYDRIGMREKSGVALLDSMGISSVNVLDPTLVLPSAFWESFASQCSSRKRPYLLVYFLHDHEEVFRQALAYARRQGFEVVRVAFHPLRKADDDKIEVIPSVEKLVSLFMNAEFVVTDSFHGTAFSLNFAKSFLVTQPPRFETRLDSILEIANAPQRVIRDSSVPFSAYGPIDYDHVTKALCREREKSRAFLNAALGD